ncbi:MAG TPA: hypothetical protein VLI39_06125, partial [Sedimentisphaerales bacterium]|nr:hypothetical protein [Sedimentisphaerales bacterium]
KEGQNHDTDLTAQSKIFIHDEMAPQPLAPPPKLRANHDQGSAIRVRYVFRCVTLRILQRTGGMSDGSCGFHAVVGGISVE